MEPFSRAGLASHHPQTHGALCLGHRIDSALVLGLGAAYLRSFSIERKVDFLVRSTI